MTNDEIGFLALEALRMHFRAEFAALSPELRAATYARRLATGHWYNVWGLPREAPSESALALVDIGPVAIPFLAPLLDSKRPAPSFGSEEATMSRLEGYRVCDYAWVFISRIEGQQPAFPAKPEERDLAIEAMTARLRRSSTP